MKEYIVEHLYELRSYLEEKYSNNIEGKCVESSELVFNYLNTQNIKSIIIEGYCKYDDDSSCSDRDYDEHTWVEIPSLNLIIDLTLDQFSFGIDMDIPKVYIGNLPYFLKYEEPK